MPERKDSGGCCFGGGLPNREELSSGGSSGSLIWRPSAALSPPEIVATGIPVSASGYRGPLFAAPVVPSGGGGLTASASPYFPSSLLGTEVMASAVAESEFERKPRTSACCCYRFRNPRFRFTDAPSIAVTPKRMRESWIAPPLQYLYRIEAPRWEVSVEACGCGQVGFVQEFCRVCDESREAVCLSRDGSILDTVSVKGHSVVYEQKECLVDYRSRKEPEADARKRCPFYKEPKPTLPCPEWLPFDVRDRPANEYEKPLPFGTILFSNTWGASGRTHLVCKDGGGLYWIGYFAWEFRFTFSLKLGEKFPCRERIPIYLPLKDSDYVLLDDYHKDVKPFHDERCKRICEDPKADDPFDCDCSKGSSVDAVKSGYASVTVVKPGHCKPEPKR